MISAAIVGIGRRGRSLVDAVHDKRTAMRFIAGYSRRRANVEAFCRAKDLTLHDELATLLADPRIDAIVLATPNSGHAEQVRCAAGAGKHVFVEQPFALDVASAEAALATVAKARVVLAAGSQRPLHPSIVALRAQ